MNVKIPIDKKKRKSASANFHSIFFTKMGNAESMPMRQNDEAPIVYCVTRLGKHNGVVFGDTIYISKSLASAQYFMEHVEHSEAHVPNDSYFLTKTFLDKEITEGIANEESIDERQL